MIALVNPYVLLAFVIWSAVLVGGGFWKGMAIEADRCEVRIGKLTMDAAQRRETELGRAIVSATKLEKRNAETKVVFREITKTVDRIVERPTYRNVCLDDDGLRAVNAALAGSRADSAESGSGVSGVGAP
ncbi:MAG: hypothetical protein ACREI9_05630 [Nitrospiraceae bacterium]